MRDLDRGTAAAGRIRATAPDADLEVRELDLASFAGVRACARSFLGDHDRLDVLVNNAGVMACPFGMTADGFELQFGTNHLGHFLLTNLLAPALVAAAPARVVSLSSRGHRFSDVDLDDPNFERTPYDPWVGYGRAKTANVLFAAAIAVHPRTISTELGRHLTDESLATLVASMPPGQETRWKPVAEGAATSVWAATAAELDGRGGVYLEDCGIAEPSDDPATHGGVRPYALDPARAAALWELSERLVGVGG